MAGTTGAAMLITNFAAGELSKTLFGRTDLPQYHSGAAKLENFDVIPTGGVRRRTGTEMILNLQRNELNTNELSHGCRLIPYTKEKNLTFMMVLFPATPASECAKLGLISITEKRIKWHNYVTLSTLPAWKTMDDINSIQYAQTDNSIILCSHAFPPLEITFTLEEATNDQGQKYEYLRWYINSFFISIDVKKHYGANISIEEAENYLPEEKEDTLYAEKGWLQKEFGQYPACVSFMNGRLVFANTCLFPQRLFFSAVNDIHDFSTYTRFINEKKEVEVFFGKITTGSNIIALNAKQELKNFGLKTYYIDNSCFESGTYITQMSSSAITVSSNAISDYSIATDKKSQLNAMLNNYVRFSQNSASNKIFSYTRDGNYTLWGKDVGLPSIQCKAVFYYYRCIFYIKAGNNSEKQFYTETYPTDIASVFTNTDIVDKQSLAKIILKAIVNAGNKNDYFKLCFQNYIDAYNAGNYTIVNDALDKETGDPTLPTIFADWKNILLGTMKFTYNTVTYYNTAPEIYKAIMGAAEASAFNYIAAYTRELQHDDLPMPDNGFSFEIASDLNEHIRWLKMGQQLIIGTETSEWLLPPEITPTAIQARRITSTGSAAFPAAAIGDFITFVKNGRRGIAQLRIPEGDEFLRGNDLLSACPHLLIESPAAAVDCVTTPYAKLIAVREDGTAVCLLIETSSQTYAWNRIRLAGRSDRPAVITSIATFPGDAYDEIWFVVNRGGTYYIERLRETHDVFLDCAMKIASAKDWMLATEFFALTERAADCRLCRIVRDAAGAVTQRVEYTIEMEGVLPRQPDWTLDGEYFIGYPYESILRTMPILSNTAMKKQRIVSAAFRFLDSALPSVGSIVNGQERRRDVITNLPAPYSGVWEVPFPGAFAEDVQLELRCADAAPAQILAINAEVQ
jgi:hypothetical protein